MEWGTRRGIDHHWQDGVFATSGAKVDVWDHDRSEPTATFSWGADTVHSVRFNPVSFLASYSPPPPAVCVHITSPPQVEHVHGTCLYQTH